MSILSWLNRIFVSDYFQKFRKKMKNSSIEFYDYSSLNRNNESYFSKKNHQNTVQKDIVAELIINNKIYNYTFLKQLLSDCFIFNIFLP